MVLWTFDVLEDLYVVFFYCSHVDVIRMGWHKVRAHRKIKIVNDDNDTYKWKCMFF